MPWVVNVTKPEFREFKRVQNLNRREPGLLGDWALKTLGKDAFVAIRLKGAVLVMRPKLKKIPCFSVSRLVEVSEEELKRLERASREKYGEEKEERKRRW